MLAFEYMYDVSWNDQLATIKIPQEYQHMHDYDLSWHWKQEHWTLFSMKCWDVL